MGEVQNEKVDSDLYQTDPFINDLSVVMTLGAGEGW